jgi:hypothetical protein
MSVFSALCSARWTGGFRVVLATDALCSSAEKIHDAMMAVYLNRFNEQVETALTETIIEHWA